MAAIRRVSTFRLDDDLRDGLQAVWERDGIQPSEQVRRAVRLWLEGKHAAPDASSKKGTTVKAEGRKRK